MSYEEVIFYFVAALTVVSALGVVTARNVVHSALFLILALVAVALIVAPLLVVRLLLGTELTGVAIPAARVTGSYVACFAQAASGASLVQVATG